MLLVAGAGMAGLCAAARANELGLETLVLEKASRPGGSMLLSSCVVWRHRSLEDFRAECPGGDPRPQQRIIEELDEALEWLESLGAPVVARGTGNPRTVGWRFDPVGLTRALVGAAGEVQLGRALAESREQRTVLATGGYGARLARERGLPLRACPWSEGEGRAFAEERGAEFWGDDAEFYGRLMPAAPFGEPDFVRASQLYGRFGVLTDRSGRALPVDPSWSEVELPQALAAAGGRGWLVVDALALEEPVRERSVADMVAVAEELGAEIRRGQMLPALCLPELAEHPRLRRAPFTAVEVAAAVTHTIGGIRIDERARVLNRDGRPIEGLLACGADAGGISTGGYASGLAAALVFGRIAAETAAAER